MEKDGCGMNWEIGWLVRCKENSEEYSEVAGIRSSLHTQG